MVNYNGLLFAPLLPLYCRLLIFGSNRTAHLWWIIYVEEDMLFEGWSFFNPIGMEKVVGRNLYHRQAEQEQTSRDIYTIASVDFLRKRITMTKMCWKLNVSGTSKIEMKNGRLVQDAPKKYIKELKKEARSQRKHVY